MTTELEAVRRELAEYVSSICFETTCTNCAHMLDVLAGTQELEDNDQLEAAKSQRIKAQQRALSDLRADRTDLRKRLDAVREYVDDPGNWSALDGRRDLLLALIDATPTTRRETEPETDQPEEGAE